MNERTGMIPNASNPYVDRSSEYVHVDVPEPPVLTLRDLERMVAARLKVERQAWAKEQQRACLQAWEEGRSAGYHRGSSNGAHAVAAAVDKVIRGHFNHSVRRLIDRSEGSKSTIAAEREFIARESHQLRNAVEALRGAIFDGGGGQA